MNKKETINDENGKKVQVEHTQEPEEDINRNETEKSNEITDKEMDKEKQHTEEVLNEAETNEVPIEKKNTGENKEEETKEQAADNKKEAEKTAEKEPKSESEQLKEQLMKLNDKYIRLSAEFDNYRKRTLKERMELLKNAGEDVLSNILPVVDNFERAIKTMESSSDIDAVKEGVQMIYKNFKDFLSQRGVQEIEAKEKDFDTDLHEAVSKIPAPDKKMRGKILDVIEKGYKLNDKVIRYAKVVVGE